jgi:hypothetical protein
MALGPTGDPKGAADQPAGTVTRDANATPSARCARMWLARSTTLSAQESIFFSSHSWRLPFHAALSAVKPSL